VAKNVLAKNVPVKNVPVKNVLAKNVPTHITSNYRTDILFSLPS
jgi:hypothetical protein